MIGSTRSLSAQHRALIFHQPKGEQCNERIGCIYDTIGEQIQKKHGGIGYQSRRQEMTGLEAWGMVLIFFIFILFSRLEYPVDRGTNGELQALRRHGVPDFPYWFVSTRLRHVNRHVPLGAVRYGGPRASITQPYHLTFKVHKNRHIVYVHPESVKIPPS